MDDIIEHFRGLVDDETLELLSKYASGENVEVKQTRVRGVVIDVGDNLQILTRDGIVEIPIKCCSEKFNLGDLVNVRSSVVNDESDFEIFGNISKTVEGVFLGRSESKFVLSIGKSILICIGSVECRRGDTLRITGFNLENEFFVLRYDVLGRGNVEDVWDRIENVQPLKIVNLRGRVSGLFGERTIKNKRTATIYISDESGRIRIVLVGDNAKLYKNLDVGDWVEIYEGYARIGYDGELEVVCDEGLAIKVF